MATDDYDKPDLLAQARLTFQGVSPRVDVITPHATNVIGPYRAIRANVAGTISVRFVGGSNSLALNIAAGETRHFAFDRVYIAGTTATGLEGIV